MEQESTDDITAAVFTAISYAPNAFLYWREMAQDLDFDTQELAKQIEREIKRDTPEVQSVYGDLLAEALGRVNWYEVADKFIRKLRRPRATDNVLDSETIQ